MNATQPNTYSSLLDAIMPVLRPTLLAAPTPTTVVPGPRDHDAVAALTTAVLQLVPGPTAADASR